LGDLIKKKETKITEKRGTLQDIFNLIKYPIIVILTLNLLGAFIKVIPSIVVDILAIVIYGYVGWSAVRKKSFGLGKAALSGALTMIIMGIVYLCILAVLGKSFLEVEGVDLAKYGVPPEMVATVAIISIVISFIVSMVIGGIVALIGAVVAQKMK